MTIELPKTKERDGKIYHLSCITEDWYFYSDYDDNNPKTNTLGFDRHTDEECSREHAYFGIYMHLLNNKTTWISKDLHKIYKKTKQ